MKHLYKSSILCATVFILLTAPASLWAVEKGILRFAIYEGAIGAEKQGTLNPLQPGPGLLYFNLQHQIFETLVEIDFSSQRIAPALAVNWKRLDDRTYQFNLRRGVRFHNGEPFDAGAVKFSLETLLDPQFKYTGRFLLNTIKRIDIIDSTTIHIITARPDAFLLRKLGAIGFILPPQYFTRVGFDYFSRYPMGTGPFRFFYRDTNNGIDEIHLVANEDYWRVARPHLRELICKLIPHDHQWELLKKNAVDLVINLEISPREEQYKPDTVKIIKHPTLRNAVCLLNIDKEGPLKDYRVRNALQHAINRQALIDRALNGYAKPLRSIAPEGSLGFDEAPVIYNEDLTKARQFLADAGYPEGFSLSVICSNQSPTPQVVAVLNEQMKRIGAILNITATSREKLFEEIVTPKLMGHAASAIHDMLVITGRTDIFGTGYYFDFFHSTGLFNPGIYTRGASPLDTIYDEALNAAHEMEAGHHLRELDHYIVEHALAIPLYQDVTVFGMQQQVNWSPSLLYYPYRFRDCY